MQKWRKLGKIFEVDNNFEWMKTHATCPFAYYLEKDIFRIFFSCRDIRGYSHGAWIDIDLNNDFKILKISQKPILEPGDIGLFDDAGVVPFKIVKHEKMLYLYYSGWTLKRTVPFDFHIGLAKSFDINNKFTKHSKIPILDRTENEPYLIGAPFVLKDNKTWKMWYISGDKWIKDRHYYSIKYAYSKDGIHWSREGIKCIDYSNEFEYAFARPFVLKEDNIYKMWYSFRAQKNIDTYRIGYAESEDGIHWIRKDSEVGIDVSEEGWDSEMICYPFVFDHKGERYMLYNGNGYGKSGIGLAVLEK